MEGEAKRIVSKHQERSQKFKMASTENTNLISVAAGPDPTPSTSTATATTTSTNADTPLSPRDPNPIERF